MGVRRSLVDARQGDERLQLVYLLGGHGVDFLERHDDILRQHQAVVLGELIGVALGGEKRTQMGWQDMQHERGLVSALRTDEREDAVIDDLVEHHRSHHRQEPATGVTEEILFRNILTVNHRKELTDIVCLAVPFWQMAYPVLEGMEGFGEVRSEDVEDSGQLHIQAVVLHLAPEGVDETVVEEIKCCRLRFFTMFEFVAQLIEPYLVSGGDVVFHFLYACLAVDGGGGEGGVLVGMGLIDAAHHRLYLTGMFCGVVFKLLESPRRAVVESHAVAVHEVYAARDVVVVASVGVFGAVGFHHLHHLLSDVFGLWRPTGTLALARRLAVERDVDFYALCERLIDGLRVPCQSAQASDIAALGVVVKPRDALIVVVHREPRRAVVLLRHLVFHSSYDTDATARDGGVGHKGVGVGSHYAKDLLHTVGRHMVEIYHDISRIGSDARLVLAAFERDLAHHRRTLPLHLPHLFFDGVRRRSVSRLHGTVVLQEQSPVLEGVVFEEVAPQDLHHLLPRHGVKLRVGEC